MSELYNMFTKMNTT